MEIPHASTKTRCGQINKHARKEKKKNYWIEKWVSNVKRQFTPKETQKKILSFTGNQGNENWNHRMRFFTYQSN